MHLPKTKWIVIGQLLLGLSLFLNLGKPALYNEEPRRALIALEMQYNDNLLVPTELGEYYYKKPPLYNWVLLVSYKIFGGASEFAVRFFSALSHWLIGFLILLFAGRYIGRGAAFLAACFWWVSVDLLFYFSMFGEIDLVYSLICFAAMAALFHFGEKGKYLLMFGIAYTLHALGLLTKGLPSIVFAGITTIAYLLSSRKWRLLWSWQHFAGMAIFLIIGGSYFWAYSRFNSPLGFVEDLWSQSADRTATQYGIGAFLLHLLKFPIITLKDLLPGSLFIPLLFVKEVRQAIWNNSFLRYCLLAFGLNILIYWISPGTRSRYVYMLYPFLLILIAWGLWFFHSRIKNWIYWMQLLCVALLGLGGLTAIAGPILTEEVPDLFQKIELIVLGFVLSACAYWAYKRAPYSHWIIILALIIGRLGFDLVIIPNRASSGEDPQVWKKEAMTIVEITEGNNLNLYQFKNEGWFSLAMTFYIEREKGQVLGLEYEPNCTDYFIGFDHEFAGQNVSLHHEFDWRTFHYYLVTFEDCP
jgi:4-amino-4-deoxy-L-arabinose transferase-like glycosyltransferase